MRRIAEALEAVRASPSRNVKVDALAAAFVEASSRAEPALAMAVRFALAEPFAAFDPRTVGVGWRMLMPALSAATGVPEEDIAMEARRFGDLGDAAEVVLAQRAEAAGLSPAEVAALFDALAATGSRGNKARLLTNALARATPIEGKYLAKTLLGEARTGAVDGVVMLAIARAFEADHEAVRRAFALVSDAAVVARLAHARQLGSARLLLGHPVQPMLATPIEASKAPVDWEHAVVEDKLDGVRAQAHVRAGLVTLFGRGQGDMTGSFPEVASLLARSTVDLVLDGEILAVAADGGPRPFHVLQARIGRRAPDPALLAEVPVAFVAYDLLRVGAESLIDEPWTVRRERLEGVARDHAALRLNPYWPVRSDEDLDRAFTLARSRGHEGVMLKRTTAPYEAGSRGASWLKVKRAAATLDVVVTAVEQGHGRRAGVLSDYTFAVQKGKSLVDVGKAYSGLTDAEIAELTSTFEATTLAQRSGWRKVTPTVVLEVAFDGLQRSDRHESGFSMRFPRIVRVRADKTPADADTLETVEALFASHLESGHREEPAPSKKRSTKKPKGTPEGQLDLFGDKKST